MPITIKEKQDIFVEELTRDFLDTLRYINNINRGRQQAQPGVMQKTVNQATTTFSNVSGLAPVLSTGTGLAAALVNATWNFSYGKKYEQRYSVVNAAVITALDTGIHDEIKKAALFLSRLFRDFLDTKLHPKSIKPLADCIADRIFNYMSKIAHEESPLEVWSSDAFIRGAFEGKSGRWKQSYWNTALKTQTESHLLTRWFNYHATTAEGLMTHTTFATKNANGQWVVYANNAPLDPQPFGKYGLAIFPPPLAEERQQKGGYTIIIPELHATTAQEEAMNQDWTALTTPITLIPTQSNETLSAKQVAQEENLAKYDLRLVNFEEAIDTMDASLSSVKQAFEDFRAAHTDTLEAFQSFLISQEQQKLHQEQQKRFEALHLLQVEAPEAYQLEVDAWLSDLEGTTNIPQSDWMDLLIRAALGDYISGRSLPLSEEEQIDYALTKEEVNKIAEAGTVSSLLPLECTSMEHVSWNTLALKHYFLSVGLWQQYQKTKQLATGEHSALWQHTSFIEPLLQRFLQYWLPEEAYPDLLYDWQVSDKSEGSLKSNIENVFATHSLPSCACVFCTGRLRTAQWIREDQERVQTAAFLATSPEIRWMRLLPMVYEFCSTAELGQEDPMLNKVYFTLEQGEAKYCTHLTPPNQLISLGEELIPTDKDALNQAISQGAFDTLTPQCKKAILDVTLKRGHTFPINHQRSDYHPGFSPHQPSYHLAHHQNRSTFQALAWHWPENYLSGFLWHMLYRELNDDQISLPHIAALVPASVNQHMAAVEKEGNKALEQTQLLQDQLFCIQRMFQLLILEDPQKIDAHRWFATYEEAYQVQSILQEKIKQKVATRYAEKFHTPCAPELKERFHRLLDEECPLLDTAFLSIQDGNHMSHLLSPDSRHASSESTQSAKEIRRHHKDSAYNREGQSRTDHLRQAYASWQHTKKKIEHYQQELDHLQAGHPLNERWNNTRFSKKEVQLLLSLLLEALSLKELIIRNYARGSEITQDGFSPDAFPAQSLRASLNQRQHTSSRFTPFEIGRESDDSLSANLTADGFRRPVTPYEIWIRAQLFLHADFWRRIEKIYPDTPLAKQGKAWAEYKEKLSAAIDQLPSLKPILSDRLGHVSNKRLNTEINQWKQALLEKEAQLVACLSDNYEKQCLHYQERHFHLHSAQMLFEKMLLELPPQMQASYQALGTKKSQAWMQALLEGNKQPIAEWFCYLFNQQRPFLFYEACYEPLKKHFVQSAVNAHAEARHRFIYQSFLSEGNFKGAYEALSSPKLHPREYFNGYAEICCALLREFQDTRRVWDSWPPEQQADWIARTFAGDRSAWEEFLLTMKGQWQPLTQATVRSLLSQGLHPDATFNGNTLVMYSIDFLSPEYPEQWNTAYLQSLENRLKATYYFLDADGVTSNWQELLKKVHYAYQAPSGSKELWLQLAAALLLCQSFQKHPSKRAEFLNDLFQLKQELTTYWDTFTEEQRSWWMKTFGSLYRRDEVCENRKNTYQKLNDYIHSIGYTVSHFYAFFGLLDKLRDQRKKQYPLGGSRLDLLVVKLHRLMEDLLKDLQVWENMTFLGLTAAQSKRLVLKQPTPVVEISVGNSYQVSSPFYTALSYQDTYAQLKHLNEQKERSAAKEKRNEKKELYTGEKELYTGEKELYTGEKELYNGEKEQRTQEKEEEFKQVDQKAAAAQAGFFSKTQEKNETDKMRADRLQRELEEEKKKNQSQARIIAELKEERGSRCTIS